MEKIIEVVAKLITACFSFLNSIFKLITNSGKETQDNKKDAADKAKSEQEHARQPTNPNYGLAIWYVLVIDGFVAFS